MKYDSIKRRFVKSSSKSRILALVQSTECSLSKTCLVSADLSNRRCRMSAKIELLSKHDPHQETFKPHRTTIQRFCHYTILPRIDRKNTALFV